MKFSIKSPYLIALIVAVFCSTTLLFAKKETPVADTAQLTQEMAAALITDSLEKFDKTIPYQTGKVDVRDIVSLNIPQGYKFIPQSQAQTIVTDFWGNPTDNSIVGMLVPANFKVSDNNAWAFVVSYEEDGYVKDEDAKDLDYDEMMKNLQASEPESNKARKEQGYDNIHILGWAAKPYYDNDRKILHWAKKVQFGDQPTAEGDLTLNYDVRILGRKGVLSMNAVGTMAQLSTINQHIPDVLSMATFKSGYAYKDFNPDYDKVAAYTVGGLIAGKLLAKAGILLLLLKNIKLVGLAIVGLFAAFRKKFAGLFRRRKDEEGTDAYVATEPAPEKDVYFADNTEAAIPVQNDHSNTDNRSTPL